MSKLWKDIQDAEKEAHILQSQAAAEKAPKNEKRTEISNPPARNSSLARSDSPTRSRNNNDTTTTTTTPTPSPASNTDDKPPTPPPKNNAPPKSSSPPGARGGDSVHIESPPKRGIWGTLVVALLSCCSPEPKTTDDEPAPIQKGTSQRLKKQSIEMDSLKNEDDQPTTSTVGPAPGVEKPIEPPPVPEKEEPTIEEHKPSVILAPDTITKRQSVGKRNITPPLGVPPTIEIDDNESTDDGELWRKEREIRHSLQIQAPFPPSDDTDALVVSPAAPSIPSDEEEEYDINEKRLYSKIDGEEPEAPLLGPTPARRRGCKTLVLDLDECLIHSSFMPERSYDFTISLTLDRGYGTSFVYVKKRPYVIEFLREMAKLYEIVIFTASLDRYANPVLDILDPLKDIDYRLFRESCTRTYDPLNRIYSPNVKNLSLLGRDLRKTIIIDNNHLCYQWHPEHAVPISSWFSDPLDVELKEMIPLLSYLASDSVTDVRDVLNPDYRLLVPADSSLLSHTS